FAVWMFFIAGIIPIILGVIAVAAEIYLIVWYEKRGKRETVENAALMDKEWKSDELIKAKLRAQGSKEHTSFSSRAIHGLIHFNMFLPIYEKFLRHYILDRKRRRRVLWVVAALFIAAVALVGTGVVRSEFFPVSDQDYVYIDMSTPVGTNLDATDAHVRDVEKLLYGYGDVTSFATTIGRASPNSGQFGGAGTGSSNLASITLTLKDKEERSMKSYTLADKIRADLAAAKVPGIDIKVSVQAGGPPAGAAFEAHVTGDDFDTLNKIVADLRPKLAAIPGVINVNVSLKDSVPEYTFKLDPRKLEENYLSAAAVGGTLRTAVSGTELMKVVRNDKEIQLLATFDDKSIPDLAAIQNLQVVNTHGQPVYLKDVATIELKPSVDVVTRIDQKRTILLSAGADSSTNGQQILAAFQKSISSYNVPAGYAITYGGENEQNAESLASVVRAMIIALVLIVATLVIQFNSFRKALIVLVPIPLALIGVFVGMAVFDVSLGLPGLIGILALFGIVVKNAIILVDKININIRFGIPFEEAVVDAGKARLEAIFITSICTIFGILPVTLSDEFWRALGSAVIFGLTLSSFLTLFIVPAFYLMFVKDETK
ncbi:MAG TPA: efflux RND transporter permease subunit, partial [Candidatus Paceibacterota bacterium]